MTQPAGDGFLLVDKASGWTSHDVVAKVRNATGARKVGHAGTLDPMATGLLVLGVGRATRLLRFAQAATKEYVARIMFGVATDSLDADGVVLSREPMRFSEDDLDHVLERFVGTIMQQPPMVSARKVEGRRLYELAREGKEVERESRPVAVHSIDIEEFAPSDYPEVVIRVRCAGGTYIRTLADDVARALGGRAHLTELRRTCNGSLHVDDAFAIDEIVAAAGSGTWVSLLLSPARGLGEIPSQQIDPEGVKAVANGVPLTGGVVRSIEHGLVRLVDGEGRLLAVYRREGNVARPEVVLS